MINKVAKKIIVIACLFVVAFSFSSCNKGYGCPNEFKMAVKVISPLVK